MNETQFAEAWAGIAAKERAAHSKQWPGVKGWPHERTKPSKEKMQDHNRRLKDRSNAAVLAAMGDKEWRSKDLAAVIGVKPETARHRMNLMLECGLVELVREEASGLHATKIWRAVR